MTTIFDSTFFLIQCQDFLAGRSTLTLRQLDLLYHDAVSALLGPDVDASLAPNVRRLLDSLDVAREQILAEVTTC